ncbi:GCN5-related N-acetyltransferase [Acidisarcina polymorpha]|uniref:GCN5-related N-acetyltransferase n=1 Tax=Acidisarcina polymorpha TaxID=2211140 RepID=A0A2Z5G7S4_9BACT|nr:GNAT family N-acetyltransferase [Acidisarcina polymorpha]AXC14715.1 GCN5-related N-acetyltransferase [Acidisarcina polymorpha]
MKAPAQKILIRRCQGFDEFDVCVRMQTEIWGYDVRDTIPLREFIVIERIGGQVFGAFDLARSNEPGGDGKSLIGFAMSMPGVKDGQAYLHSHMLAVLPEYRDMGIGRKLKLAQRQDALARGIQRMEWTFDPLEIKNAYLNVARLGAVVHSYTPNFYGVFSSRLQAGLPTDRLHAEWWMNSPRVDSALNGEPALSSEVVETIVVPGAVQAWKQSPVTLSEAEAVQSEVRRRFLDAFTRGLTVVGFTKENSGKKLNGSGGGEINGVYQLGFWRRPEVPQLLKAARQPSHEA